MNNDNKAMINQTLINTVKEAERVIEENGSINNKTMITMNNNNEAMITIQLNRSGNISNKHSGGGDVSD